MSVPRGPWRPGRPGWRSQGQKESGQGGHVKGRWSGLPAGTRAAGQGDNIYPTPPSAEGPALKQQAGQPLVAPTTRLTLASELFCTAGSEKGAGIKNSPAGPERDTCSPRAQFSPPERKSRTKGDY